MRLDQYLVAHGHATSRARAQAAIAAGNVQVNGVTATKPALSVPPGAAIHYAGDAHDYVSRGGVKLAEILRVAPISVAGKTCLDLGASTGGFTDVLLRADAAKVYAVDVGTGQLHPTLLADPRVVNLEKTHAKDLSPALISDPIDMIVCDVSFISLKKVLPTALSLAGGEAHLLALVKPQFEVGPAQIGKGGIVKPARANHEGVAEAMLKWIEGQPGWRGLNIVKSPIAGGDGNIEFLIAAQKSG